jgi:hypothetical protein
MQSNQPTVVCKGREEVSMLAREKGEQGGPHAKERRRLWRCKRGAGREGGKEHGEEEQEIVAVPSRKKDE